MRGRNKPPLPGEVSAKADGGVLEEVKEEQYLGIIKMFDADVLEKLTFQKEQYEYESFIQWSK